MFIFSDVLVGRSNAPIATAIQSRCIGSQNREEPHILQNPRRIFSDEKYQEMSLSPRMFISDFGMSVEAKQCPECLRHLIQWQTSGCGISQFTSNLIAPHKHEPECNADILEIPSSAYYGKVNCSTISGKGFQIRLNPFMIRL
jgi:hypothetical protein